MTYLLLRMTLSSPAVSGSSVSCPSSSGTAKLAPGNLTTRYTTCGAEKILGHCIVHAAWMIQIPIRKFVVCVRLFVCLFVWIDLLCFRPGEKVAARDKYEGGQEREREREREREGGREREGEGMRASCAERCVSTRLSQDATCSPTTRRLGLEVSQKTRPSPSGKVAKDMRPSPPCTAGLHTEAGKKQGKGRKVEAES